MVYFQYHLIEKWPPLVWLAECINADSAIKVFHGSMVETNQTWFCEAVWDGNYDQGDFDRTDLIFGSGAHIRGSEVTFVSSGTTEDRLQSLAFDKGARISNSLACLLAFSKASLDPTYNRYFEDFGTILQGIRDCKRTLNTSVGTVQFTYFDNLQWHGEGLYEIEKPHQPRDFSSFIKYRDFLSVSLGKVLENMASEHRQHPLRMLGSLSSGYDSPAVTVLAKPYGLREAITFTQSRTGKQDDGSKIADLLGIQLFYVERDAWRTHELAEVPFIASDAKGEDVHFKGAEVHLKGCVLLTGFHGSQAWGKKPESLTPVIARADQSGLSLTEYRLWAGFINLPIAFMGIRQIRELSAISNSPEMAPWDIPGDYSRPIARRIVETAGVPRELFGMSKKATSVLLFTITIDSRLSSQTRRQYYEFLNNQTNTWLSQGSIPPYIFGGILEYFNQSYDFLFQTSYRINEGASGPLKFISDRVVGRLQYFKHHRINQFKHIDPFTYIFPWAIEMAKQRYTL